MAGQAAVEWYFGGIELWKYGILDDARCRRCAPTLVGDPVSVDAAAPESATDHDPHLALFALVVYRTGPLQSLVSSFPGMK